MDLLYKHLGWHHTSLRVYFKQWIGYNPRECKEFITRYYEDVLDLAQFAAYTDTRVPIPRSIDSIEALIPNWSRMILTKAERRLLLRHVAKLRCELSQNLSKLKVSTVHVFLSRKSTIGTLLRKTIKGKIRLVNSHGELVSNFETWKFMIL